MRRALVLLLLCAGGLRAEPVDVLFAAATDAELQPLLARLTHLHTETRAAWQFWTGTLGARTIAATRTEGDPLNAVAATTLAIRRYAPKLVVTFGAARAHDPALQAGDVVVSRAFAAFDGMVSAPRPLDGGSAPLTWHRLPHPMMTAGETETDLATFPADAPALAMAEKLQPPRGKLVAGILGSANQVNREADRVDWLRSTWGTSTEDGDSAHVAGCALLFGVPVVGIRVVDGTPAEAAALALEFLESAQ